MSIYERSKKMKQLSLEDINLDMSTVNNVISNVMPIIWAAIALLEWMAAEEKEDKIYAAVMMILAMAARR